MSRHPFVNPKSILKGSFYARASKQVSFVTSPFRRLPPPLPPPRPSHGCHSRGCRRLPRSHELQGHHSVPHRGKVRREGKGQNSKGECCGFPALHSPAPAMKFSLHPSPASPPQVHSLHALSSRVWWRRESTKLPPRLRDVNGGGRAEVWSWEKKIKEGRREGTLVFRVERLKCSLPKPPLACSPVCFAPGAVADAPPPPAGGSARSGTPLGDLIGYSVPEVSRRCQWPWPARATGPPGRRPDLEKGSVGLLSSPPTAMLTR